MNLLNRPKVMTETDTLELQSLWRTRDNNRSSILPVLNEIQELIGRCTVFELFHVKREANIVAHDLAKVCLDFMFRTYLCMKPNWNWHWIAPNAEVWMA
jgi:hypothetical protein